MPQRASVVARALLGARPAPPRVGALADVGLVVVRGHGPASIRVHIPAKSGSVLAVVSDVDAPRSRAPPGPARPPRWPSGGRRRWRTSPPCSGAGSISRPSDSSVTRPPSPFSSVARAASRSVSWPRRWAIPVSRRRAVGHRGDGGDDRRQLPDLAEVGVQAPQHGRTPDARGQRRRDAPRTHRSQQVREPCAGLGGRRRPVADGDLAAGHHRRGDERQGVGQVRLHHPVQRSDGSRSHLEAPARPADARRGGDDTVLGEHRHRHVEMRDRRAPDRSCSSRPSVEPGRRQHQPADELAGRAGVDGRRAAAQRAATPDPNREPALVRLEVSPEGDAERRAADPSAVRGPADRRPARPPRSARQASGGTKRITVPASPQSIRAGPASGPGATRQPSSATSIPVPRARSASIISRVSRASSPWRMVLGPSARAARISARLVIDLLPGTATTARTGPAAVGAGQMDLTQAGYAEPARPAAGRTNSS